ncbi:MAG: hypothetical protein H7Y17_01945 [Chlorobia bacterium]|nr:hypothetical protein [Fimbriimonadaceae bacterium]
MVTATLAALLLAPITLTDVQVYGRCQAKLDKVTRLTYEVHGYEGEKYKGLYGKMSIDLKRGYTFGEPPKWRTVCDLKRIWSKYEDGTKHVEPTDGWDSISNVLGFDIIPGRFSPDFRRDKAQILQFDKRRCYAINPKYGESPLVSYTIYVDSKTWLPAGYSESQMGESGGTIAYRNVKLNPKLAPSLFVVPNNS